MIKRVLIFLLLCSNLFGATSIINAFNAGEISPQLNGRTDIAKYYSGCETLENFLVFSYGGASRRPGTMYIADAKNSDEACRLIPFEFSTEQAYILEFGDEYIRFYKDGGQIQDGSSPCEISTPYDTDAGTNLFELHYIQSADTMYITHPDYAPRKLTRTGHTSWTLTEVDFKRGPFLTENTTTTTITPSATTGTITLTASSAIFDVNDHVGALWQVTHTAEGESVSGSFSHDVNAQDSNSLTMQLNRKYLFTTHGTWAGDVILQRSYDSGTVWKDVLPVHYESDGNREYTESETVEDAIYRVHTDANDNGIDSGTLKYNLTALSFDIEGVVELTVIASTTSATGTVENTLGGTTATTNWAEGAFSLDEGYPATCSFYEERIAYAATTNQPQTVWLSQTGEWDNFLAGNLDSDAMSYTIAADEVNAIRWLSPQSWLLIGTTGGEWKMGSGSDGALTPTDRVAKKQSNNGSANLQPAVSNNVIIYVQRQARKVRELVFSFEVDSWLSPDLTILSEHITNSGIVQTAFQKTPDPILWTVLTDGRIATMTYQRSQDVVGWGEQNSGDADFESVAVIPGDGEDEVWVSVERLVDGSIVRYIEQFQPRDFGADQNDIFFVDSGLSFDGGDAVVITDITSASPAVVTAAAHGYSDGDQVRITSVVGMTEINNHVYTVDDAATNTFSLDDTLNNNINSVGFTAYTSGGSVEQVENTFTTLSHLEGEMVDICADGEFYGTDTVASGTITLSDYYNTVHAGLNYVSKLAPMQLAIPGNVIAGKTKRITDITARFYKTLQCKYGPTADSVLDLFDFSEEYTNDIDVKQSLFTGERKQEFDGDYRTVGEIYLQVDEPVPCSILSISPEFEVYR